MENITALRGACPAPFLQESKFPDAGGCTFEICPQSLEMFLVDGKQSYLADSAHLSLHSTATSVAVCLVRTQIGCILIVRDSLSRLPSQALTVSRRLLWPHSNSELAECGWYRVRSDHTHLFRRIARAEDPPPLSQRMPHSRCCDDAGQSCVTMVGVETMLTDTQMGFIIPLGASPSQCHNLITPNDMFTDLTCAFSGAFLLAGGWAAIVWSEFWRKSMLWSLV